ncbi:hypothetical protein LTR97_001630 [Elasticomyces elasticus]|uniref:AB hydrolase-1 domain-containing protein n=1 Tax=Elasticomyces elasticus TaxID=574655 RepID=A0AAN8A567_9PEZI|nr:hypothetical protein LTR97_001630 [Elasticomyces elasticus]
MPTVEANQITINYQLEGESGELVVLINGLADDLTTWDYQVPALLKAGYRVLRYDNRGIGKTSRPPGPYTSEMLANDLHALLDALDINEGFHLLGDVMRDVTLWAFTVPFFRNREDMLKLVEDDMEKLDMQLPEYLAQLNVIQKFDSTSALESLRADEEVLGGLSEASKVMVLAGRSDILIPVALSRELAERLEGCQFVTTKGGHATMWEFPEDFNKAMLHFLDEQRAAELVHSRRVARAQS